MNNKIFIYSCSGFFFAILIGSFLKINLTISLSFAFLAIVFLFFYYLNLFNKNKILLLSIFITFLSIGFLRIYTKDISQKPNTLDNFIEQEVVIDGLVVKEVEVRDTGQRILIKANNISLYNEDYEINNKILVSTSFYPKVNYGDFILVSGKLTKPENFLTDIGKEFDYKNYLRKDGIFYSMSFADVEVLKNNQANKFFYEILKLKSKFLKTIEKIIPAPESSLLSGLLLGVKGSLGDKLNQDFIDTGLVHIIVLSGYNVTIIAEAVIKTLSFITLSFSIYFGILFIVIFAIMTGAGATIIRASIMAILALIARVTGRNYEISRALIFAAFLMVFHNPYILVFDISFQLSFLSTLGLIYLTPVFEKYLKFLPNKFSFREIISATLATQIFVLPFLLYKIGNLSIVSPVTNVLVLPLIPATMFFGFLTGVFGLINYFFALPFGFISYILLKLEITVVEIFAKIPFANIEISEFPFSLVLVSYVFIFYFIKKRLKNLKENDTK